MSLKALKRRILRRLHLLPQREYKLYVAKPGAYDVLGPIQFKLLKSLGMRPQHYLLDIGCGSLAGGRFAIRYLAPGHYFGIEPEQRLIDAAVKYELGSKLVEAKRPTFNNDHNFGLAGFGRRFNFMMAHSIMTHASQAQIRRLMSEARQALAPGGIFIATYREGDADYDGSDWVYPAGICYTSARIAALVSEQSLRCIPIEWPHVSQNWVAICHPGDEPSLTARMRHIGRDAFLAKWSFRPGWQKRLLAASDLGRNRMGQAQTNR